jgi:NAD-dependent deacetylase
LNSSVSPRDIQIARRSLDSAATVVVLTGAGISADSGVPTFRGHGGLWKDHRPEELATPAAFARDPRLVWEWYGWRRALVAACRPNEAHLALARWAADRSGVHLITQNVDGLHVAAAGDAGAVLELHGSLFRTRCPGCGATEESRESIDASSESTLPRCDRCGDTLRPDVVWFGEPLDSHVLGRSFELAEQTEACLVVGTSGVVQPAASIASVAARAGAALVEVNLEPTPITASADVSLRGRAAEIVPRLVGRSE